MCLPSSACWLPVARSYHQSIPETSWIACVLLCCPSSIYTGVIQVHHEDKGLQTWFFFQFSKEDFFLLPDQKGSAGSHHVIHIGLPTPDPHGLSWLIAHPKAELHPFTLLFHMKGKFLPSPAVLLKEPVSMQGSTPVMSVIPRCLRGPSEPCNFRQIS